MAILYLAQFVLLLVLIIANKSIFNSIVQKQGQSYVLILCMLLLFLKFLLNLINELFLKLDEDERTVPSQILLQTQSILGNVQTILFYNFMFNLKIVQITIENMNSAMQVLKDVRRLYIMVNITIASIAIAFISYAVVFSVLYSIYPDHTTLVFVTTIIELGIFIPLRLGLVYLMIFFWRIGQYFVDVLQSEYSITGNKCTKLIIAISFLYEIMAQLLSVVYWVYPSIRYFQNQ